MRFLAPCLFCGCSPALEVEIIVGSEMRTIVVEAIIERATPPRSANDLLSDEVRLAELGVDSLGPILILVDVSARTGLQLDLQEGMSPIRTVGDVVQFAFDRSQQGAPK